MNSNDMFLITADGEPIQPDGIDTVMTGKEADLVMAFLQTVNPNKEFAICKVSYPNKPNLRVIK